MVVEELEEGFRLFFLEANNAAREARVDEQGPLSGHGVYTDNRVLQRSDFDQLWTYRSITGTNLCLNRLTTDGATTLPGVLSLVDGRVNSAQALETFPKLGR